MNKPYAIKIGEQYYNEDRAFPLTSFDDRTQYPSWGEAKLALNDVLFWSAVDKPEIINIEGE